MYFDVARASMMNLITDGNDGRAHEKAPAAIDR